MTGWAAIELEVQTPLFGGGYGSGVATGGVRARPSEVRVSEIRSMARFWLRALVGAVLGDDLDAVGAVESAVFGSTERDSRILMRIPRQPDSSDSADGGFLNFKVTHNGDEFAGNAYLVGPGLSKSRGGRFELTRQHTPAGEAFTLLVRRATRATEEEWLLARAALWMAIVLGGIGARSRRGFGSLQMVRSDLEFPTPQSSDGRDSTMFADSAAKTIPVRFFGDVVGAISIVLKRAVAGVSSDGPRSYPTLGEGGVAVHASKGGDDPTYPGDWKEALAWVGLDLRLFRANEHHPPGVVNYHPRVKTKEWLDVIHGPAGATDHFPLGALGLPIVFKRGVEVNAVLDGTSVRWPSPLWLRLGGAPGSHRLASMAFTTPLPGSGHGMPAMRYTGQGVTRSLTTSPGDFTQIAQAWFRFVDGYDVLRPAP